MLYQLSYSRNQQYYKHNETVGRAGFEPTKSYDSRFTVCPSWPLWYLPKHNKQRTNEPMEGFEPTTC